MGLEFGHVILLCLLHTIMSTLTGTFVQEVSVCHKSQKLQFYYRQFFDEFPLFISSMDVCTTSQLEIMNIRKMVFSTRPCHFVRSSTETETSILKMRLWKLTPK